MTAAFYDRIYTAIPNLRPLPAAIGDSNLQRRFRSFALASYWGLFEQCVFI